MGRACKRYRIFCNAYRKFCRPNSGGDTAFLSLALLSDFYLTGRGCSRFWPPNSRCLQSVQFFYDNRDGENNLDGCLGCLHCRIYNKDDNVVQHKQRCRVVGVVGVCKKRLTKFGRSAADAYFCSHNTILYILCTHKDLNYC